MHYIRHYNILHAEDTSLLDVLRTRFNIFCENIRLNHTGEYYSFNFEVPENHPRFDEIERILPNVFINEGDYNANDTHSQKVYIIYYPVFSEDEYDCAKWLSVRSSFSKMVPKDEDEGIKYTCSLEEDGSSSWKSMHRSVHTHLSLKKFTAWGNRAFASFIYSESELFCRSQIRDILLNGGFNGLDFIPAYRDSQNYRNDIYQICNSHIIKNEAIVGDIDMQDCECPICNMKMLAYNNTRGMFQVKESLIDDSIDFYKTPPMFLSSPNQISGSSKTVISQKLYRYIKDNKMDRALHFVPLKTV